MATNVSMKQRDMIQCALEERNRMAFARSVAPLGENCRVAQNKPHISTANTLDQNAGRLIV